MIGRQMILSLHLLYQPVEANIATAYTTHQYMINLNKHLRRAFAFAQKHWDKNAEGCKADQKVSYDKLQVGYKARYYILCVISWHIDNILKEIAV